LDNNLTKILLLAPGISIHSQRFLQMLLDLGHAVTLVDTHNPKPQRGKYYQFIPLPSTRFEYSKIRGSTRLSYWFKLAKLRLIWQTVKPDLVHVHWVDQRAFLCAQARLHPLILTCWGADINSHFEKPITESRHRSQTVQALSAADHITADADEVLERCQMLVGHSVPTSIFYFGINFNKFKSGYQAERLDWRKKYNIADDVPVFLSVRRPIRQMGHDYILRAFAEFVKTGNSQAVIVFVRFLSQNSEYEDELNQLAFEYGIQENIIWVDGVEYDKLPLLYAAIDYVINYPIHDGLPVSLFEAVACKKPILTANLMAYADVLKKGDFIVIPPENVEALAAAIHNVVTMPQEKLSSQIQDNYTLIKQIADERECYYKLEQTYINLISAHKQ
jgi:glycosyltransferase involved in cell wall biosynthesis